MKIPSYRKLQKADIPELDDSVFHAVASVADQVASLTSACQRRLGVEENMGWEIRDIAMVHDEEYRVKLNVIRPPVLGVVLAYTALDDYAKVKWRPIDEREIGVTVYWDSTPTVPALCRLVVMGR